MFAVLLIGFLLPQILLSGLGGLGMNNRVMWLHVLLLLFDAVFPSGSDERRTNAANEDLETRSLAQWQALRPLQAVLRYLAAWLPRFWALECVMLFNKDRQFLHDRIAGTWIMHATSNERNERRALATLNSNY